jgi:hypothetical protein
MNLNEYETTTLKIPYLQPHEIRTAKYFVKLGIEVKAVIPSRIQGIKNPDIKMRGLYWEIKAPIEYGKYTIQNCCEKAWKQSKNIIFDFHRLEIKNKNVEKNVIIEIGHQFSFIKEKKIILIITKFGRELLALNKDKKGKKSRTEEIEFTIKNEFAIINVLRGISLLNKI